MVELLLIIFLTPILFILLYLLKLTVKLFNLTLALTVWVIKKLWLLVKRLAGLSYRINVKSRLLKYG